MLHRSTRATLIAVIALALAVSGAPAPARAAAPVPKVVLVVGPVGDLTARFRAQADLAAAAAEAAGAQVVRVYSPFATWPLVERAAQGASIVVYLGHGNGWPSRYRSALYPPTQNGFGLNPVAGVDDDAHQYFGEAFVEDLRLAPNAVVLLHHLCYASGSSEPGLDEGTLDDAVQRVDNFASGFLRAGARAVVAEAYLGPATYVEAILRSNLTIEQVWARSPTAHGHAFSVPSVRTPGFTAWLDPDTATGGYFRSLVSAGLTTEAIRAGAMGIAGSSIIGPPGQPSLAGRGLRFEAPALSTLPVAGSGSQLLIPVATGLGALPRGTTVGIRWDPIVLDPVVSPVPGPSAPPSPAPSASPAPSPSPVPSPAPAASPGPSPSPVIEPPPEVELVAPERLGTIVTLADATPTRAGLRVRVELPQAPGLYRLVPSLHTASGIAYDESTQALLTPVIVRVGGPVAVAYGVDPSLVLETATRTSLAVRVVNAGRETWDVTSPTPPGGDASALLVWLRTGRTPATLVATWVSVGGQGAPDPAHAALDPAVSAAGGTGTVALTLVAPATPGEYLLLIDVLSPVLGPLSSRGSPPAIVRVSVTGTPVIAGG